MISSLGIRPLVVASRAHEKKGVSCRRQPCVSSHLQAVGQPIIGAAGQAFHHNVCADRTKRNAQHNFARSRKPARRLFSGHPILKVKQQHRSTMSDSPGPNLQALIRRVPAPPEGALALKRDAVPCPPGARNRPNFWVTASPICASSKFFTQAFACLLPDLSDRNGAPGIATRAKAAKGLSPAI